MTTLKISPSFCRGTIQVPSSKSVGHRLLICAGLSQDHCIVDKVTLSEDIQATNNCLAALGVDVLRFPTDARGRGAFSYRRQAQLRPDQKVLDCGESGSTLRFLIPVAAALGARVTFTGHGRLGKRPLTPYYDIFKEQGLAYTTGPNGELPLTLQGKLHAGKFVVPGDVSSQFISGLLFALPLLEDDSEIKILPPVESASYIGLTLEALRRFGIQVTSGPDHTYQVPGRQSYRAPQVRVSVEGDWSQAAFWLAAGTVSGDISCQGLAAASGQGDKAILTILQRMGAQIKWQEQASKNMTSASLSGVENGLGKMKLRAVKALTFGCTIDAADCPDLVPILSTLAALSQGTTKIIRAERLRLKECDRLSAMTRELNKLGASVQELPNGMVIKGKPEGLAGGVTVSSWNDHRIAMSLAVAAMRCRQPILLTGSECVKKSYPAFWQDLQQVGGKVETV